MVGVLAIMTSPPSLRYHCLCTLTFGRSLLKGVFEEKRKELHHREISWSFKSAQMDADKQSKELGAFLQKRVVDILEAPRGRNRGRSVLRKALDHWENVQTLEMRCGQTRPISRDVDLVGKNLSFFGLSFTRSFKSASSAGIALRQVTICRPKRPLNQHGMF